MRRSLSVGPFQVPQSGSPFTNAWMQGQKWPASYGIIWNVWSKQKRRSYFYWFHTFPYYIILYIYYVPIVAGSIVIFAYCKSASVLGKISIITSSGWWFQPLWKILISEIGSSSQLLWKIKNDPHHQPVIFVCQLIWYAHCVTLVSLNVAMSYSTEPFISMTRIWSLSPLHPHYTTMLQTMFVGQVRWSHHRWWLNHYPRAIKHST